MPHYESLDPAIAEQIENDRKQVVFSPYACRDETVIRRDMTHDNATAIRPPFIRDIDKILHCPFYNRYADKTQVFSFYKNDDLSRRGLHVQLVSRIARTLGRALGLNLELIEAIALGHDIGHTPFGHAGEEMLDRLYHEHTGRHFSHNIHSVQVLDRIFPYNISLQTLNGIAAHDGELEMREYRPAPMTDFGTFDSMIESCRADRVNIKKLLPSTLEGCVVRISDIIAYLGKDRQDAARAHRIDVFPFADGVIGTLNAEIINNLMVNIVENSYGKPYIKMDSAHFDALQTAKAENYAWIYRSDEIAETLDRTVRPMMAELYEKLRGDLVKGDRKSVIFTHHIGEVTAAHYTRKTPYESTDPDQIVVDYIAGMTDDYFIDLYAHLFPDSPRKITYKGYFD